MSVLEDKIKKNRELFDVEEPSEGHFERFRQKLEGSLQEEIPRRMRFMPGKMTLRIAAIILTIIAISSVIYFLNPIEQNNQLSANTLPVELQEAKMYYNNIAQEKMQQIDRCTNNEEQATEIRHDAIQQLQQLDSNTTKLEQDLIQNQNNQQIKNALIINYKTKADLMNEILKRLCNI